MADNSTEKTEQPSERRLRESREKGQVSRSKDFNNFMVILLGLFTITVTAQNIVHDFKNIYTKHFNFTRDYMFDDALLFKALVASLRSSAYTLMPFFIVLLLVIVGSGFLIGGINFTWQACAFNMERLDPIQGLKKIFSTKTLFELIKSLMKFTLLAVTFFIIVYNIGLQYFALDSIESHVGIYSAVKLIEKSIYWLILPLIIVVMLDVPYQIYELNQQLKMTKQEVKDEHKESDGSPEVKSRIRKMQYDLRKRKMMQAIPSADVIITNPQHYAVAISYKDGLMNAPVVVAKGLDYIAELIKKVAIAHEVPIVEAPPVARSLYYNVELEDPIPTGLYIAVARVLTFVHELNLFKKGKISRPKLIESFAIPAELVR